jgi:hypothetical protein
MGFEELMDLHIKLLQLNSSGNHLIVIIRGLIDTGGFKQIFHKAAEAAEKLPECMVLIDLEDALLRIEPHDIHTIVDAVEVNRWPHKHKIALVSSPEAEKFDPLYVLGAYLCALGLKVAVFKETKSAICWLGDRV